jgi:hypothetical protein
MYGALLLVALGASAITHSETRAVLTAVLLFILEQKVTRGFYRGFQRFSWVSRGIFRTPPKKQILLEQKVRSRRAVLLCRKCKVPAWGCAGGHGGASPGAALWKPVCR